MPFAETAPARWMSSTSAGSAFLNRQRNYHARRRSPDSHVARGSRGIVVDGLADDAVADVLREADIERVPLWRGACAGSKRDLAAPKAVETREWPTLKGLEMLEGIRFAGEAGGGVGVR